MEDSKIWGLTLIAYIFLNLTLIYLTGAYPADRIFTLGNTATNDLNVKIDPYENFLIELKLCPSSTQLSISNSSQTLINCFKPYEEVYLPLAIRVYVMGIYYKFQFTPAIVWSFFQGGQLILLWSAGYFLNYEWMRMAMLPTGVGIITQVCAMLVQGIALIWYSGQYFSKDLVGIGPGRLLFLNRDFLFDSLLNCTVCFLLRLFCLGVAIVFFKKLIRTRGKRFLEPTKKHKQKLSKKTKNPQNLSFQNQVDHLMF